MQEKFLIVAKEVLELEYFNLDIYNQYIKKYGKNTVLKVFSYIMKDNNNSSDIFDKYFDAFFSIELDSVEIDLNTYNVLIKKYGKNRVELFFKNLLELNNNPDIRKKYEPILSYIDIKLEDKDDFVFDDSVTQYFSYVNRAVLTQEEEKGSFMIMQICKDEIDTAYFDDVDNIHFYNFDKILRSVKNKKQLRLVYKIKDYLSNEDKIIYNNNYEVLKKAFKNNEFLLKDEEDIYRDDYLEGQLIKIDTYYRIKNKIAESNLKLVTFAVKKFYNSTVEIIDLIQEGNKGLLTAIRKFDVTKGNKFSTYALWWIRQSIARATSDQSRLIRIPIYADNRILKINKTINDFEAKYGYTPSDIEIADCLGWNVKTVNELMGNFNLMLSLDVSIEDDEDISFGSLIADNKSVFEEAASNQLKEIISKVVDTLPPREAIVIKKRFGLDGYEDKTLEEVGKSLGLTKERVRQIENKALERLRHPARAKIIKDFYY